MPKIKPMALIENMRGKVCQHSDTYFRTRQKDGKVFAAKICNPSTKPDSTAQTANKTKFAAVAALTKQVFADKTAETYLNYKKQFDQQTKIATIYAFVFADKWKNYEG